MSLPSFTSTLATPSPAAAEEGPTLEHSTDPGLLLRIRARRSYNISREELFGAWTRRSALDLWLRIRSRSRVMLSPHVGGAFRLELAEGPTIHVITGTVLDLQPSEFLSLSWSHQAKGDHASVVQVAFRERNRKGELVLLHRDIENRREAAWLMKIWSNALGRLGGYFAEGAPFARSA